MYSRLIFGPIFGLVLHVNVVVFDVGDVLGALEVSGEREGEVKAAAAVQKLRETTEPNTTHSVQN